MRIQFANTARMEFRHIRDYLESRLNTRLLSKFRRNPSWQPGDHFHRVQPLYETTFTRLRSQAESHLRVFDCELKNALERRERSGSSWKKIRVCFRSEFSKYKSCCYRKRCKGMKRKNNGKKGRRSEKEMYIRGTRITHASRNFRPTFVELTREISRYLSE